MPRSSKHKSSKHSSRDTRDYSDSEKDSGLKERKVKEENLSKASKESSSSEKRKLDSKDVKDTHALGNGEYSDEYVYLKKRKERVDGGVGDKWDVGEGSKKSKSSADLKGSRRRDGSVGVHGEDEDVKKSSGKSEGKHKDSNRKESRDVIPEKGKKFKEGRSERLGDNGELRTPKQVVENTDSSALDELENHEIDNLHEKRTRKKRDDSGDGGKNLDDDKGKDGRQRDVKRKDDKYRDMYKEEVKDRHRHDKQKDECLAKDHTRSRSEDKYTKEDKNTTELRQKRIKSQEGDRNRDRNHYRDFDGHWDRNVETGRDHENYLERDSGQERVLHRLHDRDRDFDRDREQDWDCDRDYKHYDDRDRVRDRDRDRDRDKERDHTHDYDEHADDRSSRYKGSGGKKRSFDDRDSCNDGKSRVFKAQLSDTEKKGSSSGRVELESDRGRSQSQHVHLDSLMSSNKQRSSPGSHPSKYEHRDSMTEQRTKGSREAGFSGLSERGSKYKPGDKPNKVDDVPVGEMSIERSSSSKASPISLVERSPSSTSFDRKNVNRGSVRRSLDIEEAGRRSVDGRDLSASEDRLNREIPPEKPFFDECTDSSFYGRTSLGSASLFPPPHVLRAGAGLDRPFKGSMEDDIRDNSGARYRRSNDPCFGRGHGNSWRGMPNWPSPLPNGFIPFQHGPTPAGFQAMIPQFPTQPLFGVRPPIDVNHSGIPYHIPDADRFPGHLRPLGWQNMMDSTVPSHLHGWDGNNGTLRDDPHAFNGSEWERSKHLLNNRGWDSNSENWKEHNSDVKRDLLSPSQKDEYHERAHADDFVAEQTVEVMHGGDNNDSIHEKVTLSKSSSFTSAEQIPISSPTHSIKKNNILTKERDNGSHFSPFYLSKLDISFELAQPELYKQCMDLLKIGESRSFHDDVTADLHLEGYTRYGPRHTTKLSRHSLFPAIESSMFQRAMDLYKKQTVKLQNGARKVVIVDSQQLKVEKPNPSHGSESMLESVQSASHTKVANVIKPDLDEKELQAVSLLVMEELREEAVQIPRHENQFGTTLKSAQNIEAALQDEVLPALSDKNEEMNSEREDAVETDRDCVALCNGSPVASGVRASDDGMKSKDITGRDSTHSADRSLACVNNTYDPLIVKDGSSEDCEALMPGSNECELRIISQIHHSPESTH